MAVGLTTAKPARLPALRLIQSTRAAQRLAQVLLVLLGVAIASMIFVPWQQSAQGTGKVVAYVPQERQQSVMAQTKGVVVYVSEGLVEGARVKRGDIILEMEPAAANLVQQINGQIGDLNTKLSTANTKAEVYAQNIRDFEAARDAAVEAAKELVSAAKAKWDAKQRLIDGYEAKELQARQNFERQKALFEKGVKPEKEVEKWKKDWDVAVSDLQAANLDVTAAEKEWEAKKSELIEKQRTAQTKVDYARAMREDALGQAATTQKEIGDYEIKLSELKRLVIYAPRDGTIFRLPVYERGQLIKEGTSLFTIVPDTTDRAVELWVSGNDTPLIHEQDHVRLQFEGWPAVQFAGWPSVAVGTFGGKVVAIDPTDDGTGKFRVLVKQDGDQPWPSDRYLRQGVRANGWVMLSQVPLGYEIWRQLNGFPPTISSKEPGVKTMGGKKKVPLPK